MIHANPLEEIEKRKEGGWGRLTIEGCNLAWGAPIHVDAASGGLNAPFLYPKLE